MSSNYPRRGEVYWVHLDPTRGFEMRKTRPCLVVTADDLNRTRFTVVVVPVSTTTPVNFPLHVALPTISTDSQAVIDQLRAVDLGRIRGFVATVSDEELEQVSEAIAWVLGLIK